MSRDRSYKRGVRDVSVHCSFIPLGGGMTSAECLKPAEIEQMHFCIDKEVIY